MAPPSALPYVRPRRVLRLVAEQARDEALSRHRPSRDPLVRARRGLAVVLRRQRHGLTRRLGIRRRRGTLRPSWSPPPSMSLLDRLKTLLYTAPGKEGDAPAGTIVVQPGGVRVMSRPTDA